MDWKKIGLKFIYPPLAVIICLLPISVACLIYSLVYLNSTSIIAIVSYVISFYVLVTVCLRVPKMVQAFKNIKEKNRYVKQFFEDVRFRMNISLYSALIFNLAFAIFQLGIGFKHQSYWFYSLSFYYVLLGCIRFILVKHTVKYKPNEKKELEKIKYVLCGWLLLVMNLALGVIIFFMVYHNRTFYHHMITTIAMAAFTFTTFIFAIINLIRFKKYKSPAYSAVRNVNLIAGCVSMLILESTMLTTFGDASSPMFRQIILSLSGLAVVVVAITISISMLIKGKNL